MQAEAEARSEKQRREEKQRGEADKHNTVKQLETHEGRGLT